MNRIAADDSVDLQFSNDCHKAENVPKLTTEKVSANLANLFSYAHQWTLKVRPADPCTLTFSSMLAAMTASEQLLCRWLQRHLGLRGVPSTAMTNGWQFPPLGVLHPFKTTDSFRTAFAAARRLCGDAEAVDVRHYMGAYAVCPDYHLEDFLRLRIDRRAWCLELSERLCELHPDEDLKWRAYATLATPVPVLAFSTDAPQGRDLLNIDREVEAFSRLVAARTTHTPLSIGVFGAWGSGKSFFMRRVRERVASFSATGEREGAASAFHGRIAQVEFNAWHYSEGNLIACLVDHVFRNLRIGLADEDDETLRRRSAALIVQLDRAKQGFVDRENDVTTAEARHAEAQRALSEIEAQIPIEISTKQREREAARAALVQTQQVLGNTRDRQQAEIDAAVARAPTRAALALFRKGLADADPNLAAAEQAVTDLVTEAKSVGARWLPITLGLVVLTIGTLAKRLAFSSLWNEFGPAVTALGALAAAGTTWLKKLGTLAQRGKDFQDAQAKIADEAAKAVEANYKPELAKLELAEQTQKAALDAAEQALDEVRGASAVEKSKVLELERQRAIALEKRERAAEDVTTKQAALTNLSTGTLLGEFLDDRASTDGYRKGLTIFTQVRNDFERLSKLMERATAEYYAGERSAPIVSRIVLYIDDLDRCPEDKVIEVLRTVHLLLAFPLFVCLVAVDPRWVTACLHKVPGLVSESGNWHVGNAIIPARVEPARVEPAPVEGGSRDKTSRLEEAFGKPATPADFLEKIFQIPLWLRPVPAAQRPDIVRALLDPALARGAVQLDAPLLRLNAVPADAAAAESALQATARALAPPAAHKAPEVVADGASARSAADLTIDAVELDYLSELGGLLDGNPRALKRFVNTYRLVKSALSDVELEVFRSHIPVLGDNKAGASYLPYRMCMAQLAVLCTQRDRALLMVNLADATTATHRTTSIDDWLNQLAAEGDAALADCFRAAFKSEGPDLLTQTTFETFALWLERTRRYSFYL